MNWAVMGFGAVVALLGLGLMYFGNQKGRNTIKAFGAEFVLSTPALVVFVVGAAILVLPFVRPMEENSPETASVSSQNEPSVTYVDSVTPDAASPKTTGSSAILPEVGKPQAFEVEPNSDFTTATDIAVGTSVGALMSGYGDQDFYHFRTPNKQSLKLRIADYTPGVIFGVRFYTSDRKSAGVYQSGVFDAATEYDLSVQPNAVYYMTISLTSISENKSYALRLD